MVVLCRIPVPSCDATADGGKPVFSRAKIDASVPRDSVGEKEEMQATHGNRETEKPRGKWIRLLARE